MSYFTEVIQRMRESRINISGNIPPNKLTQEFAEECIEYLFPLYAKYLNCSHTEEVCLFNIESNLSRILIPVKENLSTDIKIITRLFIESFPKIYKLLVKDAKAIHEFDPASKSLGEIIVTYPGFYAITIYRLAHRLFELQVPILPRLLSEYAHSKTGIDIHPGAEIGESFFIDHGTGVVIGETCVIQNNVKIYQGVTLGAAHVSKDLANVKRHPTVEDNVIIYSNATILGGNTVIGHDTVLGGNVWVTESVDPNSIVFNQNETTIKSNNKIKDNFLSWSYEI
jgi:serine O-acetyltransferase